MTTKVLFLFTPLPPLFPFKELNRPIDGAVLPSGDGYRLIEEPGPVDDRLPLHEPCRREPDHLQKLEPGNLELIRELQPFVSMTGVEECGVRRVEEVEGVRLSVGQIAK